MVDAVSGSWAAVLGGLQSEDVVGEVGFGFEVEVSARDASQVVEGFAEDYPLKFLHGWGHIEVVVEIWLSEGLDVEIGTSWKI